MAKKKAPAKSKKNSKTIDKKSVTVYTMKITLKETKPPVWRRIEVPEGSLHDLHGAIQALMPWADAHLYLFEINGEQYSDPSQLDDCLDSHEVSLRELVDDGIVEFHYVYDMGDDWTHQIKIEKVSSVEPKVKYPRCVAGARACPPEDCGGAWGYANFLDVLKNPKHPEHKEMKEWIGGSFDPEKFDMAELNEGMR